MIPFNLSEYQNRRTRLIERIRALSPFQSALIVIPAKNETVGTYGVSRYRPDSTFLYFTGLREPEAVLILDVRPHSAETCLLLRPKDATRELWDGLRLGVEAAPEALSIDKAKSINHLEQELVQRLENHQALCYSFGKDSPMDALLIRLMQEQRAKVRQGIAPIEMMIDLHRHSDDMRLIKSAWEIEQMRHACKISAQVMGEVMPRVQAGVNEHEICGFLLGEYVRRGLSAPSYTPIVGSYANACILHYNDNNARMPDNALTLIDAAGEYYGYCADITRTIPTARQFTQAQREIYEIVHAAHSAAIAQVRVGAHFNEYHEAALRVITEGLIALKFIEGDVATAIAEERYKPYFMHRTGHFLGMDTHDVGLYRLHHEWRKLTPGMILTVEPGIYIRPQAHIPAQYHHIGIRLEDDILVTADQPENLTIEAPIHIRDIEKLKS